MSKKLIHTEVKENRMVKVYRDSQWQEYVCELYEFETVLSFGKKTCAWVKNALASSHDTDKQSALDTAQAMLNY